MKLPITGQAIEALKANDPFLRGAMPLVRRDPGDASIGTGGFTQGVPAFWFARSMEYGTAETLYTPYADSPWVRSAIQKISQPISSCEILFTKPSSTKVRSKGRGKTLKQLSTSRGIIYRSEDELLDLPQIAATGEAELDRIVAALNTAGARLAHVLRGGTLQNLYPDELAAALLSPV